MYIHEVKLLKISAIFFDMWKIKGINKMQNYVVLMKEETKKSKIINK